MPQFRLLPGATGVDLPGGRSVKADHRSTITVDDATAAQIRSSSAMRRYDAVQEVHRRGGALPTRDDYVHTCGFAPWSWQTVCPRCGEAITKEVFV